MKKLLLLISLIYLAACNNNIDPTPSHHYYTLSDAAINFLPYKVGDTISFTNELNKFIKFTCIERIQYDSVVNVGCATKKDLCDIYTFGTNRAKFTSSDTSYGLTVTVLANGNYTQTGFALKQKSFGDDVLIGNVCFPGSLHDCVDSVLVNSKKYKDVYRFINLKDTLYYTKLNGIIKFGLQNTPLKETWSKN